MNTLHLLNGDGTAHTFQQTTLTGDYLVWREILSEGPAPALPEPVFWEMRSHYIQQTYGEAASTYQEKVLGELLKLESFADYDEVVLWFEFDLLCQINLIYLLQWFAEKDLKNTALSVISVDRHLEVRHFLGMGQLTPAQLQELPRLKTPITAAERRTAQKVWLAYTSPDPATLETMAAQDIPGFAFLRKALRAHLQRFPSVANGLNRIEHLLLRLVAEEASTSEKLMQRFWERETIYGLGDWQILYYVKRLHPLALRLDGISLRITSLGEKLLSNTTDWLEHRRPDYWVGGVRLQPGAPCWRWDAEKEKLMKEE